MNVRRTEVDWDPTLMRIEYLDDKGQPYYCSFEKNAPDRALEIPPEKTPAAAGRTFQREQLS